MQARAKSRFVNSRRDPISSMDGLAANDINNGFAHFSCMQLTAELTALHCIHVQYPIRNSQITHYKFQTNR